MKRNFQVDTAEYPFLPHWFSYQDAHVHYVDEGEGPAVVMLHGNPTWSFLYRKVIRELDGRCRTIVPDYPGFGYSEHPVGYGYTPVEHAATIGALVDHLELKRFFLVGQDWGGPIGMAVAADRVDRVAGFTIGNTWCWEPNFSIWVFSKLMGGPLGRYLILQRNLFADKLVKGALQTHGEADPKVLAAYTAPFPTPESRMGTWIFPKALTSERSWLLATEQRLMPLRDRPVELLWGERDPIFRSPAFDIRWRRHFPEAASERIANAGHFFQEDRPDRVAAAVVRMLDRAGM
jgi:haloalkane dehalogenase